MWFHSRSSNCIFQEPQTALYLLVRYFNLNFEARRLKLCMWQWFDLSYSLKAIWGRPRLSLIIQDGNGARTFSKRQISNLNFLGHWIENCLILIKVFSSKSHGTKTSRSIFASKLKKSHRRRQPSSQSDHAEGKKKPWKTCCNLHDQFSNRFWKNMS